MPDLSMVPPVRDDRPEATESSDLEAETAHRINMLVARTNAWRRGSIQTPPVAAAGVEPAAS